MHWPTRLAVVALLLVGTGYALSTADFDEEDYEYRVDEPPEMLSDAGAHVPTVDYRNLTSSERAVFDAAREGDGSVRRDEKVSGSHFRYSWDQYLDGVTLVERGDQTHAVQGQVLRPAFALHYWGPALVILAGITAGIVALCGSAWRTLRSST